MPTVVLLLAYAESLCYTNAYISGFLIILTGNKYQALFATKMYTQLGFFYMGIITLPMDFGILIFNRRFLGFLLQ